jgi:hypothetical protein
MEATDHFLTKFDDVDETTVIRLLKDIRDAAYELSCRATSLFEYEGFKSPVPPVQLFPSRLADFLGPKLCSALEQGKHARDSIFVQLALHALILGLVADTFNEGWCPAEVIQFSRDISTTGKLLFDLNNKPLFSNVSTISFPEVQAVSARWRQLASKMHRIQPADSRTSLQLCAGIALEFIVDFFWCATGQVHGQSQVRSQFIKYTSGLDKIWNMTFDMMLNVRERILANDYKLVFVDGGEPYDQP